MRGYKVVSSDSEAKKERVVSYWNLRFSFFRRKTTRS